METIIDAIKKLPGITAELCGSWLWISGNTFPVRKDLKNLGLSFSHQKRMWYFHEGPYKKISHRELSMDEIEKMYGREILT